MALAACMTPATAQSVDPRASASLKTVAVSTAAPDIPFKNYDEDAERQLLELVNQDRAQAGAQPLKLDPGLSQAARQHAWAMYDARQISHRFDGEAALAQRLVANTSLQLDQEAENVALDYDAPGAQKHLMLSPPHRTNLLNPAYNVVGLGVVRSGGRLYVVQDFAHAIENYSPKELKDGIASAVDQLRRSGRKSPLPRHDLASADEAACSMAKADKLGTAPVRDLARKYNVLTFTSLHPQALPTTAPQLVNGPNLRSFSVGACYGRTETYPTGVYWVVLLID